MKKIFTTLLGIITTIAALSQTNYYVNDNNTSGDVFTSAIGNNANPGTAALPFATIQHAADIASAGDIIYVDAGTYAEQVTINKGLTIIGAGQNLTSIVNPASALVPPPGPFTEYGLIQTTQGIGDVHISNLTATNSPSGNGHTIMIQSGGSVKYCKLVNGGQGVFFRVESAVKTARIEYNTIQPSFIGINCQGSGLTAIIQNNNITSASQFYSAVFAGLDFGPLPQLTIMNNAINNYGLFGGMALWVSSYNGNYNNNSIVGTGIAIERYSGLGNTPNATCNWYGTADQITIASKMNGVINFSPWLVNGTDNDAAIGFQPVPGSCAGRQLFFVNDNSLTGDVYTTAVGNNANSGSFSAPLATITAAVAKAQAGDIILVDAGNYTEQININKAIVIKGAGKTLTFINGPAAPIAALPDWAEKGIIQSIGGIGDVIIEDLLVDGTNSDEQYSIMIQGGGRVSNCEMRNANSGFFFRHISTQPRTAIGNNNYIHNISFVGVLFAGNGLSAEAYNNVIDLNGGGLGFIAGWGGDGNLASFTASNNSIINFNGFGMMIGSIQPAQVHNNSITKIAGNNTYILNVHTVNIDATCNWYGTTDAAAIIPNMSGTIAYSPWLINGTDNDGAIGFQPVANACSGRQNKFYVNDNSLTGDVFTTAVGNDANSGIPSAPLLTIGAALTKVQAGDSIFVDAGTYTVNDFTIDKGVTILGSNYLNSPNNPANKLQINPTRNAESMITGATIELASSNISLQGLALNPLNKIALKMNFNAAVTGNYGNIDLNKNRFIISSNQAQIILIGQGDANTTAVGLVNSGFMISDNRFEKNDATNGNVTSIHLVKNVTVTNNAFVVTGATARTQIGVNMGNNGVIDGVNITNNVFDRYVTAVAGNRYANVVITGNKIYNTTNAFNVNNTLAGSATIEFSNNILDGSNGIMPFTQYNRQGGSTAGSSSLFKAENNTISVNAVPGTSVLLGAFNITYFNGVLNSSAIVRGNTMNFGGNLSSVEGQFIRPIFFRGNLQNVSIDHNEITLNGTNLQPKNPASPLPVCPAISLYTDNGVSSVLPSGAVINISNNKIQGFKQSFIIFDPGVGSDPYTGFGNLGNGITVNVNYNSFTGDSMSINNGTISNEINASCNWYGSSADQDFINKLSLETINPIPWLTNGTDSDPAVGFQPAAGACDGYPPVIVLDSYTNVTCNGANNGAIHITTTYGKAPFTYTWTKDGDAGFVSHDEDPGSLAPGTYHLSVVDGNGSTIFINSLDGDGLGSVTVTITEPPALTASATGTNVSCFNGSNGTVSVTAGGGILPYTYLWTNGGTGASISNLTAGIYSVTVTDGNGCTKSSSYQVTQPTLLTAVASGTSTSCANTATVVASGGTLPYSYAWSNGATTQSITSIPAGTYTVIVTDNKGCTASSSVTVTATEAFNPSASVTNVLCFGGATGSITVTNANGAEPFQYSINGVNFQSSNVFNGLIAGPYTITVKDVNGCTGFVEKTINEPAQLVVTQGNVQSTCSGQSTGSISVVVSGGSPSYSYQWTGPGGYSSTQASISGLAAGNYTVTVTDSKGCTSNTIITVPAFPVINVAVIETDVLCRGNASGSIDLTVTGGSGSGFSYLWSNGATTQDIFNLLGGNNSNNNYSVTILDLGNGCGVTQGFSITQPASVVGISTTKTNVTGCASPGAITIAGSGGTSPYQYSIDGTNYQSSASFTGLPAGNYTAYVKDANGCIKSSALLSITDNGSDEYESSPYNIGNTNNNNKSKAASISLGTTISARIGTAGDVDYYKLGTSNTWTGNYTITVIQPSTAVLVDLVQFNGTTVQQPASSSGNNKYYNGLSGTYYVRVSGTNSLNCYQLTVSSGLITRSAGTSIQQEVTKTPKKDGLFDVKVLDNPSSKGFVMNVITSSDEKMSMRVFDAQGRLIEERQSLQPFEMLRIGERYISGVYLVEIVQASNRKTVRVVKM